jgi:prepilin-type N-terminal cleavage/methylation domain-containing protein
MSISRMRDEKGFTLIELLIVIVVLGILAGIVLFAVGNTKGSAESAKADSNERICKTAIAAAEATDAADSWRDFVEDVGDDPVDCDPFL